MLLWGFSFQVSISSSPLLSASCSPCPRGGASSGAQHPPRHRPWVPGLGTVLVGKCRAQRGSGFTGRAPECCWGKEGTGRSGPWGEPSSCSEPVFAVSEGEAVNSPGLIESRCCGFGLIRPPPPPSLDNVSLKPLCKLTAFLRAEPGGSRRPWPRCTALSLPRSGPGRVGRRDPLVENGPARDVDGDGLGMLRVVGEGCSETQGCAKPSGAGRNGIGLV